MPEMDGLEVLRRLKQIAFDRQSEALAGRAAVELAESPHVTVGNQAMSQGADAAALNPPVILFSAVDDPAVISDAYQHGASDFWVKASFKFDDLPKAIEQHLARSHA
jgi:CheY-like chemotaxis protein